MTFEEAELEKPRSNRYFSMPLQAAGGAEQVLDAELDRRIREQEAEIARLRAELKKEPVARPYNGYFDLFGDGSVMVRCSVPDESNFDLDARVSAGQKVETLGVDDIVKARASWTCEDVSAGQRDIWGKRLSAAKAFDEGLEEGFSDHVSAGQELVMENGKRAAVGGPPKTATDGYLQKPRSECCGYWAESVFEDDLR